MSRPAGGDATGHEEPAQAQGGLPYWRHITYYFSERPECQPDPDAATPDARSAAAEGFARWQRFGVDVIESEGPPQEIVAAVVEVCFLPDKSALVGAFGRTDWDDWRATIRIRTDVVPWWLTSIATHEMGHVVLRSGDHLVEGEIGIMAVKAAALTYDFVETDLAFLAERGMSAQPMTRR